MVKKSYPPQMRRTHSMNLTFNDKEWEAIKTYLAHYKIDNRGRWFRETIMREVIKRLEMDQPLLFDEEEMW
ncbi:hypothetical protein [Falsiporphyromonas endometrii]|uniref:Uncharacterized protein n=1 Tax=Falsiporphyromonas endometrii TaxID=1387297 RepID=A0ABV9KA09_9PORP|nr:hypothetical protein [Porphyromonadaceae bacterium]